ncbi:MAG TPA: FAD-dependent oxidoreductase [Hydrogenophaga sp.]|jgi:NAD(P)H-nitrite reductase large subunit|uniref:NAD(P)/FAD-dependent oxidoreductase n=1 Tax=Hydrogenophaga TaxID=47420 RepID=UPI0008C47995|nr:MULTISPECIES: FAD-dependent oxidoreductase [Hydrogenophaga]OGA76657.1 MAG: pyridine nucleotide-disulfide oxidoreductase [Burkholderiales bacterium GWE1_65_30]OGA91573.1 MAG: pyridine nucleotide-disulfide oxidoreductase [Burkholderiales bacterium GWF1_66_17]OGB35630.1 MAG: pyridine nucleotide-disulfide oxidoreductase [Burkholderiales bacterium RIFCSPLOWO2_02_FULL_66_35]PKO74096.1 MAG: FAD-dependent oxidoreductase [Betaproteobacteria bacterium HGW-Betaproteobacteria-15]MDO9031519.1 FAD-depend
MTHHVILGAGPAGVIAAETIRKHAPHDRITVIGDENEAPYSRMAIPYLLIGKVGEEGTHLRHTAGHFEALNIKVLRGVRAKQLDSANRSIGLSDGNTLHFDKLLIATGSSPATPPIPGIDGPGVHSCWTLADARAIANLAKPGAKVLQMGAGFIGCIIMESLQQRGVELSVVEMGDRMVPRMMGPTAGGMIKDWCQKKGVKVFTGARVEAIERGDGAEPGLLGKIAQVVGIGSSNASNGKMQVRLSTGDRLEADLVISATGVKPNIGFLENSGVRCLVGVLTDEHLQTNVPGIYAAGDCAEAFDKVSGKTIVSAIQPNAAEQARVAALNMVGQSAELKGVTQINVLDTLGMISTSFGNWEGLPGGEHVELTDEKSGRHLSLQFKDDLMVGCNSVGWTDHVGVMRGLVEGQVRLGEWKDTLMADPTKLMDAYLASAQGQGQWSGAADDRRR